MLKSHEFSRQRADAPPVSVAQVVIAALAICAAAITWIRASQITLPHNWQGDFQYFWQAGRSWLTATSAYGPEYLEQGALLFANFTNPFFYPPNALPVFSILALMPPAYAAALLYCASACSIVLIAVLTSRLARALGSTVPNAYIFGSLIIFLALYMRPALRVAIIGQPTILLALGFCVFLYGMVQRRSKLMSIGLTALLIKPHFGLPILIFALSRQDTRTPALIAIIATTLLVVVGLGVDAPIEQTRSFLSNISAYATLPENSTLKLGGLTALAEYYSIQVPITAKLALAATAALVVARIASTPLAKCAGACAVLSLSFLLFPNHSTDFVLLAPAAVYIFTPTSNATRAIFAVLLLVLGRSWDIARLVTPPNFDHAATAGALHTLVFAGMAMIFVLIATQFTHKHRHLWRC